MALQDTFKSLANNSCLALVYSYYLSPYALRSQHMINVITGWRKDFIDDECTVVKPEDYLNLIDNMHRKFKVETVIGEPPIDGKAYPVMYSKNEGKTGHFVLMRNGRIIFDPLDYSTNVKMGKIYSYRKITVC